MLVKADPDQIPVVSRIGSTMPGEQWRDRWEAHVGGVLTGQLWIKGTSAAWSIFAYFYLASDAIITPELREQFERDRVVAALRGVGDAI